LNYWKILKRSLKRAVFYLPEQIKFPFIRSIIRFNPEIGSDVVVKVADCIEEVEAAFQIMNEAYREQGFLDDRRDFTVLNKYQLLPMSTIIVALYRGQVVGTLTLVKQNPLGLPMERVFKIQHFNEKTERAAEITCLAIDRQYRRETGTDLLFPLMKFMYHYAIDYFDVKKIFVACFPREADFYKSLLLFQDIGENSQTEDYLGAPAMGLYLDLVQAKDQYRVVYSKAKPTKNLYRYFTEMKSDQLIFPDRSFLKNSDSIWSFETLKEFLEKKPTFRLPSLSEAELTSFKRFYAGQGHTQSLFPSHMTYLDERQHRRFEANNPIQAFDDKTKSVLAHIDLQLLEVSKMGLQISSDHEFKMTQFYFFSVQISNNTWSLVKTTPIWIQPGVKIGFKILASDAAWNEYIAFLEQRPQTSRYSKAS